MSILLALLLLIFGFDDQYKTTYYADSFVNQPMYCNEELYNPNDITIIAAASIPCGTTIILCSQICITATIKDRCGGCNQNQLDLSLAGYKLLGNPDVVSVIFPTR